MCVDPVARHVECGCQSGGVNEVDRPQLRREQVGDAVGDSVGKYPFQDAQLQCLLARLRRIERRVLRVCHGRQRGRVLLEPLRIAVGGYLPPAQVWKWPALSSTMRTPTVVNLRQQTDCMPYVTIDGVTIDADRLMLLPLEVAQIMRIEEREVCNMIRRGELQDVSSDSRRRLDPNEVIVVVEERVATGELGPHVFVELAALIAGRL
jgi:hypothetical protein